MLKEALFWEKFTGNSINCQLCMCKCIIDEGDLGWCQTRLNKNGVLYTLTYGRVANLSVSPIEKNNMYNVQIGYLNRTYAFDIYPRID